MRNIRVTPLAAESLGVRSMCAYVETPELRILLDAGVSLCPYRFGLPPHPIEFKAIERLRKQIACAADKSEVVTISHYHFDHHTPSYEDWVCNWTISNETARQIYEGKTVLLKNFREKINYSQRRRGWIFGKTGGKYAKKLENADAKSFAFGTTEVKFSNPVPHGSPNSFLGWVLMVTIERDEEKFMFAPDVQGPISEDTLRTILVEKPQLLIIGGPPLYLPDSKVNQDEMALGLKNLERIVESIPCVILEHHILRDEKWREKSKKIFDKAGEAQSKVLTAAEFLRKQNMFYESSRDKLYQQQPPTEEFNEWKRQIKSVRNPSRPPI
jgi:predicted metallo-beta-lactamase superfamily hydrolase